MITLVLPGSIRWLNLEDKPPPGRMPDLEDLADLSCASNTKISKTELEWTQTHTTVEET
jgi:hypothetical protein